MREPLLQAGTHAVEVVQQRLPGKMMKAMEPYRRPRMSGGTAYRVMESSEIAIKDNSFLKVSADIKGVGI